MNPKKAKLLKLDSDPSKDQEFINDLFDFFWSQARKDIVGITYHRININGLGIFEIKNKSLSKTLQKYRSGLEKHDATFFSKYPRYEGIRKRLELLEKAEQNIIEEKTRKKSIKNLRSESNNPNLEK